MHWTYLLVYVALALVVVGWHVVRRSRKERAHHEVLKEATDSGMTEPPSLHPIVDAARCMGSAACVKACPEQALGIINGKAVLVNPAHCIGHGACQPVCPVDAIQLVFGTEKRGIDIPYVQPNFETNIEGIFIAGELGGMGLIRKAAEQGRQALESIRDRKGGNPDLDVVIVGAGPAGLSAGLGAIQHKLRYRIVEQEDSLGGAIYHYPRNKIAMTAPLKLPVIGNVRMGEISKEKLLEFWQAVVKKTGLTVGFNEKMENIERKEGSFVVKTSKASYQTRSVLLAIGRRGSPRKLGVAGEEQQKVVYRLVDPEQYRGMAVLVVGGGDSALEAATAIAEQPDSTVVLSYRSGAFQRVKERNRQRLAEQEEAGRVRVIFNSKVKKIKAKTVTLEFDHAVEEMPNDGVIVCAGGELPMPLLQKIGIAFETKHGTE
ncbi:MAG TPA: NAD(P)-binding domain-containing protein [Burkholderiaceae bacterium]|nr:NAD(P)-binding domain-containing protein [Burkholderiaceae bacterium]